MFKKRSRSNGSSRSTSPGPVDLGNELEILSIVDGGEDVPPPSRNEYVDPEIQIIDPQHNDLETDVDLNPDIQYNYTARHPMGNILLKLLNENTKLAEAANVKSMDFSAKDLCSQFYNAQLLEKQRLKSRIIQTTQGIENMILSKEMDSHTINQSILPP